MFDVLEFDVNEVLNDFVSIQFYQITFYLFEQSEGFFCLSRQTQFRDCLNVIPRHEKTCLRGFRQVKTQTGLLS